MVWFLLIVPIIGLNLGVEDRTLYHFCHVLFDIFFLLIFLVFEVLISDEVRSNVARKED